MNTVLFYFFIFYFHFVVGQNNGTGTPCTWYGVSGRCVSIYKCITAVMNIKEKHYPPVCSFEVDTPIICCTDCELVDDFRLILFDPFLGLLNKTGTNKAKDKCLDYIHALNYPCKKNIHRKKFRSILDPNRNCTKGDWVHTTISAGFAAGGRNALREEYTHMALLGFGDSVEAASWLCGGTVISERFILTAAHCLEVPRIGPVNFIALGILKRSDPFETWQLYNVKNAIRHPEYRPPSKYNDIALLETDREITFNAQVRPACLHVDDKIDKFAFATGWGALGHNKGLADTLQTVGLHEFTNEECSSYYPVHRNLLNGYDHNTQMCYGDRNDTETPTDTCEGDSGGPLQSYDHEMCVSTILGVTSYGRQCGKSKGAGVYTRVSHYVPWIEDTVWP